MKCLLYLDITLWLVYFMVVLSSLVLCDKHMKSTGLQKGYIFALSLSNAYLANY